MILRSITKRCSFFSTIIDQLTRQYSQQPSFNIFIPHLTTESINPYQLFSIIKTFPYHHATYTTLWQRYQQYPATDNFRILLSKIAFQITDYYLNKNQLESAKTISQSALAILEQCALPPVLQYHHIYCQYGLILLKTGNTKQARDILIESVDIIKQFIQHSQDVVIDASIVVPIAYTQLIHLDLQNTDKWFELGWKAWQQIDNRKYSNQHYAKIVSFRISKLRKEGQEWKAFKEKHRKLIHQKLHFLIDQV